MCCDDKTLTEDDYDDDCLEFETIDEEIHEIFLDEEYDIDEYWSKGWVRNSEGLGRSDATGYQDRLYRCFPTRYRLKEFRLNKGLRKILKRNADLKTIIRPFRASDGKDDLYTAHHHARFDREHERYTVRRRFQYLIYMLMYLMYKFFDQV